MVLAGVLQEYAVQSRRLELEADVSGRTRLERRERDGSVALPERHDVVEEAWRGKRVGREFRGPLH